MLLSESHLFPSTHHINSKFFKVFKSLHKLDQTYVLVLFLLQHTVFLSPLSLTLYDHSYQHTFSNGGYFTSAVPPSCLHHVLFIAKLKSQLIKEPFSNYYIFLVIAFSGDSSFAHHRVLYFLSALYIFYCEVLY